MDIFMSVLICFFAVYGVFQLMYNISCRLTKSKAINPKLIHRVIPVDNDNENIEAYVRYLAVRDEGEEVVLLNCSDNDRIEELLELIEVEFGFVNVMTYSEYIEYLNSKLYKNIRED